jgi:hypothetical protein
LPFLSITPSLISMATTTTGPPALSPGARVLANRSLRHAIITGYACSVPTSWQKWDKARLAELLLVNREVFASVVAILWRTVSLRDIPRGIDRVSCEAAGLGWDLRMPASSGTTIAPLPC